MGRRGKKRPQGPPKRTKTPSRGFPHQGWGGSQPPKKQNFTGKVPRSRPLRKPKKTAKVEQHPERW